MHLRSLFGGTSRLCAVFEDMEKLVGLQNDIFDLMEAEVSTNDKEFKILMNRLMSRVRMTNPSTVAKFSEWRSEEGLRRGLNNV